MITMSSFQRISSIALRSFCVLVLLFLMAPILVIVPLSFNSEPFFSYPMPGFSLQWYREFFGWIKRYAAPGAARRGRR